MKVLHRLFSTALVLSLALSLGFAARAAAAGTIVFDSIPEPLPGNLPSQPYQAQQAAEVGDHILFAGTARNLSSVTVTLSSWAKHSEYPS